MGGSPVGSAILPSRLREAIAVLLRGAIVIAMVCGNAGRIGTSLSAIASAIFCVAKLFGVSGTTILGGRSVIAVVCPTGRAIKSRRVPSTGAIGRRTGLSRFGLIAIALSGPTSICRRRALVGSRRVRGEVSFAIDMRRIAFRRGGGPLFGNGRHAVAEMANRTTPTVVAAVENGRGDGNYGRPVAVITPSAYGVRSAQADGHSAGNLPFITMDAAACCVYSISGLATIAR